MQVPKFKEFITETDKEKKFCVYCLLQMADSKDPKENTTADLIKRRM